MKKLFLSLLVVASAAFGFQDVVTFANSYKPKTVALTLGDVMDADGNIVGEASCRDGKYVISYTVFNGFTKYIGKYDKVYDNENLDHMCNIVNNADETYSGLEMNDKGLKTYTDNLKCVTVEQQYVRHTPNEFIKTSSTTTYTQKCMTAPSFVDPFAKFPKLPSSYGKPFPEIYKEAMEIINKWNSVHGKVDALWIDQGEERFRPTREQFQEILNGANSGGIIFDSEFNWYAEVWGNKDGSLGYKTTEGNPEYRKMRDSMLVGTAEVETMIRNNEYRFQYRYYYDCVQTNSGRGDNRFYGAVVSRIYDKREGIETKPIHTYPAPDSQGSFTCNTSMKGAILDYKEFWAYANAGKALLIPVYVK
jgi:hypothetical protein